MYKIYVFSLVHERSESPEKMSTTSSIDSDEGEWEMVQKSDLVLVSPLYDWKYTRVSLSAKNSPIMDTFCTMDL